MLKAHPFISTFIHLFVKSAPAHPKPRNVSPFKVIGSFTLKNSKKHKVKNYDWHLLVMVITHTLQHRPKCPLISHLKKFSHISEWEISPLSTGIPVRYSHAKK